MILGDLEVAAYLGRIQKTAFLSNGFFITYREKMDLFSKPKR
jgi:hypothetical protein